MAQYLASPVVCKYLGPGIQPIRGRKRAGSYSPLWTMSEYPKSGIATTTESHSASQSEELSNGIKVPARFADESFKLFSKIQVAEPTPKEAIAIRNKCLWRIIPFLCLGYHLMYLDKQTVSIPSYLLVMRMELDVVGTARQLRNPGNHGRCAPKFDSVQLAFVDLLSGIPDSGVAAELGPAAISRWEVACWKFDRLVRSPSPLLHLHIRKFITGILTRDRGCIILLHAPCNSFASLFVVRFLLGLAEACIVPAFLIIMSMFFTYGEQAVIMPIMWSIGNASPITSGLLSYGVLWIDTGDFAPWKWFMGMSALD